jgi:hypothetical protein
MTEETDIKDINTYMPDEVSTEILKDDWRIVMAWWSQIIAGREFTYSREQVIDLAALIYEEMKKRNIEFHPETMKPSSKKLFEIVSNRKIEDGELQQKTSLDEDTDAAFRSLPGLILTKPHGTLLASGEKTLVVKSVPFEIENKEFYIVQDDEVLGIVEFDKMREISIEDFRKFEEGHKISEAERKEWWPEADKLYLYQISALNKFKEPIKVIRPKGSQTFIKKIKFSNDQNLAHIIRSGEKMGPVIKLEDILKTFESFYINRPFITLVGGLANHPVEGTTGDVDLLIRARKPTGCEQLPLVFRLYRMFPKEMWDRIQLLWNNQDFDGPFTNYVNLYDQKIEKRSDSKKLVLMSEGKTIEELGNYPEFNDDFNVPSEEQPNDVLRSENMNIIKEAKTSRDSGVVPFRYFEMLKGVAGYRKQEAYSIEGVQEFIAEKDYPVEVDEKFDGMRLQIHKKGNKVKILSLDGADITDKLPEIAAEALKQKDSVRDAELTGWGSGLRKGKHIGRSDVSGYVHTKEGLPKNKFFIANVFDLVWFEGKDIHNSPLSERRAALETIGSSDHIKTIDMKLAKDKADLANKIKWASAFPGSEGAMIKSWASKYPLTAFTNKWVKFKKEADLDAEVLDVHPVAGGSTYNYLMILRETSGEPIPVGRTYNTPIKAKKGDILRVAFGNLNMYEDPTTKKAWYNWVFPRVIEPREDKNTPDNDLTARAIHEETNGEFGQKPYPTRYKELLKIDRMNDWLIGYPDGGLGDITTLFDFTEDELGELMTFHPVGLGYDRAHHNNVFDADPFLTPADESKDWKFILQLHFRGKSVHGDFRNERPSFLVGWTINLQKEGFPSKDIDTLEEARKFISNPSNIKEFRQGHEGAQQVVLEKKSPQPKQWLTAEGVYQPGEVGGTKEHEGVFINGAEGTVEFGVSKPYFHEYFYTAVKGPLKDIIQGRFVTRLLKNVWGPETSGRSQFVWMGWFTKDNEPYILSRRAVSLGVMPPEGLSWLPRNVRKQIPKDFQYWKLKGTKAKKARDNLVNAMKKEIKINFDNISSDSQSLSPKGKFTLSHIGWRGPIVQRLGWSRQEWHLFLEDNGKVFDIILDQDPKENVKVPAVIGSRKPIDLLSMKGPVKPKTELNPDKKTPAFISIIETGNFKVISETPDVITLDLKGAGLRGKYILARENQGASLWNLSKE